MRRLIFFLLTIPRLALAQLDANYEYDKEFVWGPFKATNGGTIGGLQFKKSILRTGNIYHTFSLDVANVKHPKEYRYPSIQGSTYIFGKTHYLYTFRFRYGQEMILFGKDTQQGVQINFGAGLGPNIALIAPYYIQEYGTGDFVKFDPAKHTGPSAIAGPGKLLQGLGQSESILGLNARANICFEFGAFKNNVAGIELGLLFDLYGREVVLVPTQVNRNFFPAGSITLYWGKRK